LAIYNDVVVTQAGIELLRNIALEPASRYLKAGNVVTSEDTITDPDTATTIEDVRQNQDYSLYSQDDNQIVLEAQLTNALVEAPYELNTIGFYAGNGLAKSNVLFAVITAMKPDSIPAGSSYPVSLDFKAIITLDTSGSVQINASYAGAVTMEQVISAISNHDKSGAAHTDIRSAVSAMPNNLFYFYNLISMSNTKYTTSGLGTNKIIEEITDINPDPNTGAFRLIAQNTSEKISDSAWQITEKLYDEKNTLIQTRTILYNKVGKEWEATVK